MRYSKRIRSAVLRKVLPPENQAVTDVSDEYGVSIVTIQAWMRLAKKGIIDSKESPEAPRAKPMQEKLELVLESAKVPEEQKGAWYREKGLHEEHLGLWEQELRDMMTEKQDKVKTENTALRKRVVSLEKELKRKEKALAEMAALMVLKKKLDETLGGDEEG